MTVQTVTLGGKSFVIVPERDFRLSAARRESLGRIVMMWPRAVGE